MRIAGLISVLYLLWSNTQAQQQGYFWLITDLHYDPTYETTHESCNDEISRDKLGQYGNYECDSPWRLVKASVEAMVKAGPNPDFIFFMGDVPHHPLHHSTSILNATLVLKVLQNVTDLIASTFPGVPVYPTIGNHDFYPTNQLPSENHPMYDSIADIWSGWISGSDDEQTFKKAAYYSKKLIANVKGRVVVVNTNLYYTADSLTTGDDPAGQFAWFDRVMTEATSRGEKVLLIIHMPVGYFEGSPSYALQPRYNARLVALIQKHGHSIQTIYSAHTHLDSFRLFYRDGKPVTSMLVAPAVTPWRARFGENKRGEAHNPGVRLHRYNRDTLALLDVEQYFLELPKANVGNATYRLEYSFRQSYGLRNASTGELQRLLQDFKGFASDNFHKYHRYNSVSAQHTSNMPCSCQCKQGHLCAIQFVNYADYRACQEKPCVSGATEKISVSMCAMVLVVGVLRHLV